MKKELLIIQTERGHHKSSIIRTISQLLIALGENTVVNIGEIGLTENINTVVEIDSLRIGVASQNDFKDNAIEVLNELKLKSCDLILCVVQIESIKKSKIENFAEENNFSITSIKSNWSKKMEVSYLTEEQIALILFKIKEVKESKN